MPWHSTGRREELIIVLAGSVLLKRRDRSRRILSRRIAAGHAAFVPVGTMHQLVNPWRPTARYVYVTG